MFFSLWMTAVGAGGVYMMHAPWAYPSGVIPNNGRTYFVLGLMWIICAVGVVHFVLNLRDSVGRSESKSLSVVLDACSRACLTIRSVWILFPFGLFTLLRILGALLTMADARLIMVRVGQAVFAPPRPFLALETIWYLFNISVSHIRHNLFASILVSTVHFAGLASSLIFLFCSVGVHRGLARYAGDEKCAEGLSFLRKMFTPVVVGCIMTVFFTIWSAYEGISCQREIARRMANWGTLSFLLQIACGAIANGFFMGGILGQLRRVWEGGSPSLEGFIRDSVRWSKPLTGISLIFSLFVVIQFRPFDRWVNQMPTLVGALLYAVPVTLMFAPFSVVLRGTDIRGALTDSLEFFRANWRGFATLLAVELSLVLLPLMILGIPEELAFRSFGRWSWMLFASTVPLYLGCMLADVFLFVAFWEFYVGASSHYGEKT